MRYIGCDYVHITCCSGPIPIFLPPYDSDLIISRNWGQTKSDFFKSDVGQFLCGLWFDSYVTFDNITAVRMVRKCIFYLCAHIACRWCQLLRVWYKWLDRWGSVRFVEHLWRSFCSNQIERKLSVFEQIVQFDCHTDDVLVRTWLTYQICTNVAV